MGGEDVRINVRDCEGMSYQSDEHCANCYSDISRTFRKKFGDDMELEGTSAVRVKLVEALNLIFGLHKRSHLSSLILDDSKYALCRGCFVLFSKLLRLFAKFSKLSSPPSYLYSVLGHKSTLCHIIPVVEIKTEQEEFFQGEPLFDQEISAWDHINFSIDADPEEESGRTGIKTPAPKDPKKASSSGQGRPRKGKTSYDGYLGGKYGRDDAVDDLNSDLEYPENISEGNEEPWIDHASLVEVNYESDDDFSDVDIQDDLDEDPDYVQVGHFLQISESEETDGCNDETKSGCGDAEDVEVESQGADTGPKVVRRLKRASLDDGGVASGKPKRKRDRTTKRYKCDICWEKFSRTDHVKRHMRCHSEKNFTCPVCAAGFKYQLRMEEHLKTHDPNYVPPPKPPKKPPAPLGTDGKPLKAKPKKNAKGFTECEICGKILPNRHNINLHLASHKGEADKTLVCEICGSAFKTNSALKNHQKFHENVRDFLCKVCGVSFKRRQHLSEHEAVKHGNQPRQFACSEPNCNKAFHRLRNLRQHRKLHGNTKYACENGCGALFTFKYNRKVHQDKSCSKAPHRIKINEERRAKCNKKMADGPLGDKAQKLNSVDRNIDGDERKEDGSFIPSPDPTNLLSTSNSDNPINFSHYSSPNFGRTQPSHFPFNFSSPMFPVGMGLNLPQPSSSASPCDPPNHHHHQLHFPPSYDRDKLNMNSTMSTSFISTINRSINDIQPNDFSYN